MYLSVSKFFCQNQGTRGIAAIAVIDRRILTTKITFFFALFRPAIDVPIIFLRLVATLTTREFEYRYVVRTSDQRQRLPNGCFLIISLCKNVIILNCRKCNT